MSTRICGILWQVHGEVARLHTCVWVIEAKAVLIKVNPATGGERSMQAYWSRPLGCGECLAGKDSLVRRLTLIHWTLIRMALPGLDASVITVFVSRSPPSPILPLTFFIIVVQVEQFRQTWRAICWGKVLKDVSGFLQYVWFSFFSFFFYYWIALRAEHKVNKIIYVQKSDANALPSMIQSKANRFNNKTTHLLIKLGPKAWNL